MAVLIESGYALPDPTHARIGYRDVTETYSATSAAAQHPASAAQSWMTYERWKPTSSPATLTAEFSATEIDYIGIGAHTLSLVDTMTVQVRIGGTWTTVSTSPEYGFSGQDNEGIMVLMSQRQASGVRVTITYSGDAPNIGKIAAGRVLTMARPFYGGHSPVMLSRDTTRQPNVSEGGEWLGTSIIRQGRSGQAQWANIRALWYRIYFDPFVQVARSQPFFFAWNPARFPDCAYAMLEGDVRPSNQGQRDLMSFSMSFKAYSDGTQPRLTKYPADYEEIYPEAILGAGLIDIAVNKEWPL